MFVLNTFLGVCSSSLLVTCPYQFDIPSVIFLEASTTLVVPRKCSFLILSLRVTPYIHLSILISFTFILFSCRFFVANVCPHKYYCRSDQFRRHPSAQNTPLHFFQILQPGPIRTVISVAIQHSSSVLVPRHFGFLIHSVRK